MSMTTPTEDLRDAIIAMNMSGDVQQRSQHQMRQFLDLMLEAAQTASGLVAHAVKLAEPLSFGIWLPHLIAPRMGS